MTTQTNLETAVDTAIASGAIAVTKLPPAAAQGAGKEAEKAATAARKATNGTAKAVRKPRASAAPSKAAKGRKKATAPVRASKAKANGKTNGTRAKLDPKGKITKLVKVSPHRSKTSYRGKKFACLRTGSTVEATVKAMESKKLPKAAGYLIYAEKEGYIKIS